MASELIGLKPAEPAVLWHRLDQVPRFRPCDVDALRFCREVPGRRVSAEQAQKAQ